MSFKCSDCQTEKERDCFYANKRLCRGVSYICKDCKKKRDKKYKQSHKELYLTYKRIWRKNNRDKENIYHRKQRSKSVSMVLNDRISRRMRSALHNKQYRKNTRKWELLVGYNVTDLRKSLESKFLPGMSWENMGEWHIDHIVPLAAFNFQKPEDIDFKRAWDLTNLRPLWAKDNFSKHTKLERPFQPSLQIGL